LKGDKEWGRGEGEAGEEEGIEAKANEGADRQKPSDSGCHPPKSALPQQPPHRLPQRFGGLKTVSQQGTVKPFDAVLAHHPKMGANAAPRTSLSVSKHQGFRRITPQRFWTDGLGKSSTGLSSLTGHTQRRGEITARQRLPHIHG
jgi:hypothetical protein